MMIQQEPGCLNAFASRCTTANYVLCYVSVLVHLGQK